MQANRIRGDDMELRNDHYLILQLIADSVERQSANELGLSADYYERERTAAELGEVWTAITLGQNDLTDDEIRLGRRRCAGRLRQLTAAGYLTRTRQERTHVYSLTARGEREFSRVTLDRFPHRLNVEVLLRQPDVPLSEIERLRPQIEAAAQTAVDALLSIIGRSCRETAGAANKAA
jgi:DNA-binding PadR family transcriptional regulator